MFSCTSLGSKTSLLLSTFLIYAFLIRSNSVLKNILLMTGSKVTHSRKSPFLNALTTSSLLPHFWPLLSFPKPVVTTTQPTCSVFHVSSQQFRTLLIYSSRFPWLCPLQRILDLLLSPSSLIHFLNLFQCYYLILFHRIRWVISVKYFT